MLLYSFYRWRLLFHDVRIDFNLSVFDLVPKVDSKILSDFRYDVISLVYMRKTPVFFSCASKLSHRSAVSGAVAFIIEPRREKNGFLPMRKQRRRSASR